jgi:hypothetical protein
VRNVPLQVELVFSVRWVARLRVHRHALTRLGAKPDDRLLARTAGHLEGMLLANWLIHGDYLRAVERDDAFHGAEAFGRRQPKPCRVLIRRLGIDVPCSVGTACGTA